MRFRDLMGIPFQDGGDGVTGIDCYGLMRLTFKKFGIVLPKTNISVCACREASNAEIETHIMRDWELIQTPTVPCGVVIAPSNQDYAWHLATWIGDNRITHITQALPSCIDDLYPRYKGRVMGFYRFIGGDR